MTFTYRHTHVSRSDDSPAMLVCANPFVLMNEDGYAWHDAPDEWRPIGPISGFEAVRAVADLMDTVDLGDLILLQHIENKHGEYAPEYVEPQDGDMVFSGTVEDAWNRLAEEGVRVGDNCWDDDADTVHNALVEHGFLVEHEEES